MKEGGWFDGCQHPNVIGDMEIKGIVSGCFENDVLGVIAQGLKCRGQRDGNLALARTEKYFDLEWPFLEAGLLCESEIRDEQSARRATPESWGCCFAN